MYSEIHIVLAKGDNKTFKIATKMLAGTFTFVLYIILQDTQS